MKVTVIEAWPGRFSSVEMDVAEGATAASIREASGLGSATSGLAVFGVKVPGDTVLQDGDRLEVLRPLTIDPKEARRKRAEARAVKHKKW